MKIEDNGKRAPQVHSEATELFLTAPIAIFLLTYCLNCSALQPFCNMPR